MQFSSDSARLDYARPLPIKIIHTHVNVDAKHINKRTLHFKITHTLERIDETKELVLDAVSLKNVVVNVPFIYNGNTLTLDLSVWQPKVTLEYTIENPIAGCYFHSGKDGLHVITDNETERARYWLATIDYPNSRPTYSFVINHLKQHKALAQGKVVDSSDVSVEYRLDFATPSYLVCFAAGEFSQFNVDDRIAYYGPLDHEEELEITFRPTQKMMKWLEKTLDYPFPWPTYRQIVSQGVQGGAMENPTLVTWNPVFLLDSTLSRERQWLVDSVNLHEMAHTYFGDLIVCRSFSHSWLKESWATYMEAHWLLQSSKLEFQREMLDNERAYFEECKRYTRAIVTNKFDSSWTLFDSHLYPGGALRLHMLYCLLTPHVFWRGVQTYVKQFAGKTVETVDFKRCLEDVSGKVLDCFFDEWVFGQGYPQLKVEVECGLKHVLVKAQQTQQQLFHISVPVVFKDESGKVIQTLLEFKDKSAVVKVEIEKCSSVELDPEMTLFFSLDFNPGIIMLKNLTKSDSLRVKVWAYRTIVTKRLDFEFVREGVFGETYPVRVAIAEASSELRGEASVALLCDILKKEEDPLALFSIIKCFKYQNSQFRETLLQYLERPVLYRAFGAALEMLGLQRNEQDLPLLIEKAGDQNVIIASSAMRGLGNTRSRKAVDFFMNQLDKQSEMHPRVFGTMLEALTDCVSWISDEPLHKHTLEVVSGVALDEYGVPFVRKSAMNAMCSLDATSFTSVFEKCKPMFPQQDWPWIDRKVAQVLAKREKGKTVVDELEKKVKDLEERIVKLELSK
jgi:aminopeptidase N